MERSYSTFSGFGGLSVMVTPLAPGGQHHLAFDPAVVGRSDEDFRGGPIPLLFLPSLDLAMGAELRRNDYEYAIRPTSVARVAAASMGIAPRSIAADTIGSGADAAGVVRLTRQVH